MRVPHHTIARCLTRILPPHLYGTLTDGLQAAYSYWINIVFWIRFVFCIMEIIFIYHKPPHIICKMFYSNSFSISWYILIQLLLTYYMSDIWSILSCRRLLSWYWWRVLLFWPLGVVIVHSVNLWTSQSRLPDSRISGKPVSSIREH